MATYYLVQVCPIDDDTETKCCIEEYETQETAMQRVLNFNGAELQLTARYYGCLNSDTGEIV